MSPNFNNHALSTQIYKSLLFSNKFWTLEVFVITKYGTRDERKFSGKKGGKAASRDMQYEKFHMQHIIFIKKNHEKAGTLKMRDTQNVT